MRHRPELDNTGKGGRSHRSHRLAKAALVGGAVALLARSGLRGRVLDALFGPEEEFEYESETEPEPLVNLGSDTPAERGEDLDDESQAQADEPHPAGVEPQDAAPHASPQT